jgi:hypothetical protein
VSDWQTQVDELLADYEGITRERYTAGQASFRAWYAQNYPDDPNVSLLIDDEVRDYRVHLTTVKGCKAAKVNAYLAPIRANVRVSYHRHRSPAPAHTFTAYPPIHLADLSRPRGNRPVPTSPSPNFSRHAAAIAHTSGQYCCPPTMLVFSRTPLGGIVIMSKFASSPADKKDQI